MDSKSPSFLDLTAIADVGAVLLDVRPAFVFSGDGGRILWANPAGLAFYGTAAMAAMLARRFSTESATARQIARLAKALPPGRPRLEQLRFSLGVRLVPAVCLVTRLPVGDALLVVADSLRGSATEPEATRAQRLVNMLAEPGVGVAVLGGGGELIAASAEISALPQAAEVLVRLVADRPEMGTLKRQAAFGGSLRLVGLAALASAGAGHAGALVVIGPEIGRVAVSEPLPVEAPKRRRQRSAKGADRPAAADAGATTAEAGFEATELGAAVEVRAHSLADVRAGTGPAVAAAHATLAQPLPSTVETPASGISKTGLPGSAPVLPHGDFNRASDRAPAAVSAGRFPVETAEQRDGTGRAPVAHDLAVAPISPNGVGPPVSQPPGPTTNSSAFTPSHPADAGIADPSDTDAANPGGISGPEAVEANLEGREQAGGGSAVAAAAPPPAVMSEADVAHGDTVQPLSATAPFVTSDPRASESVAPASRNPDPAEVPAAGTGRPEGADGESPPPRKAPARTTETADPGPAAATEDPAGPPPTPVSPASTGAVGAPVRFVFQMDAAGRFTLVSPEFAAVVGSGAAAIVGRLWPEVAALLRLDPAGAVARAIARRDTWSGVTVWWPVDAEAVRVPVDLAALPAFGRDRTFEGFRGFGVCRPADRHLDPDRRLPPPVQAPPSDVDWDAGPVVVSGGRDESNVVRLPMSAGAEARGGERLNGNEQDAFRRIAEALRAAMPRRPDPDSVQPQGKPGEPRGPSLVVAPAAGPAATDSEPAPSEPRRPRATPPLGLVAPPAASAPESASSGNPADREAAVATPSPGRGPSPPVERRSPAEPVVSARLLDALPAGVLVFRDVALYANRAFLERTGYRDLAEIAAAGGPDVLFADPDDHGGDPTAEPGRDRPLLLRGRDGSPLPASARLHSVPWGDGHALMLAVAPPAKPVAATSQHSGAATAGDEPALRIAELEAVLDTATDGVVVIDREARIVSINRSAEALFGIDGADVAGAPFVTLLAEESRRAALDYLDGLAGNGVASVLNDGREVIGRVPRGGLIPLFMTMGRLGETGKFCAVLRDITQWKNAEEELIAARRAAEMASTQKSDFLAKISHEIRTPLNAIIGFSELMMEERFGPVGNDRYREYLRDINRSGALLMSLINDLLDLSKIEAGKLDLAFEAVQANEIVQECVALMQPQANRERIIIRTSLSPDAPRVVADARSLRQIVLNLLSNAVKFTQAGGQVIVSTTLEDAGDVVIRIRDTGVGMSAHDLETALKPFRQLTTSGRARADGTGLGLPLTKALVEANRATFAIDSAIGEGTMVRVTFPTSRVLG